MAKKENLMLAGGGLLIAAFMLAGKKAEGGEDGGGGADQFLLTTGVSPSNGGTVTPGGLVDAGADVTVEATPAQGYTFSKWTTGDGSTAYDNPLTFAMTEDANLTANFTLSATQEQIQAAYDAMNAAFEAMMVVYNDGQANEWYIYVGDQPAWIAELTAAVDDYVAAHDTYVDLMGMPEQEYVSGQAFADSAQGMGWSYYAQ